MYKLHYHYFFSLDGFPCYVYINLAAYISIQHCTPIMCILMIQVTISLHMYHTDKLDYSVFLKRAISRCHTYSNLQ